MDRSLGYSKNNLSKITIGGVYFCPVFSMRKIRVNKTQ